MYNDVTVFESVQCNFHFDALLVNVFARLLDDDDDLTSSASHPVTQADITSMDNNDTKVTPSRSPLIFLDSHVSPTLP